MAQTASEDITREAKVSRRVFYANFKSREPCFLTAWDTLATYLHELAAGAAADREGDPPRQIVAALSAVLAFLAAEPELARFFMVESLAAGPRAVGGGELAAFLLSPYLG